jgi:cytochrome b
MIAMAEEARVKVWDIAVRVFHWSLVVSFFVAYSSGDDESLLHVYSGYAVLALVAFRVLWGLVGTKHARFSDFIYGPAATLRYVRAFVSSRPLHYLGHNPLGGWMVVALLVCLIATCWSGLEAYGGQGHGPLASSDTWIVSAAMADDGGGQGRSERGRRKNRTKAQKFWKETHEALANLTLFLVFLHVAGALTASAVHKENFIKAMITGYKIRREP